MKRPGLCASLSLLLLLPPEAGAGSFQAEASGLRLKLTSEPGQPIQGRETVYTLSVRDAAGRQVTGAKVTLMGRMPDGMTVLAPLTETSQAGLYSGRVLFTMEGEWRLTVRIIQTDTPLELSFTEQVGR
ncbi:MAG: FixH family protein [candidate division NC10 bacterium]|nr:FixH family protein [candidate division NC10 bacterium]